MPLVPSLSPLAQENAYCTFPNGNAIYFISKPPSLHQPCHLRESLHSMKNVREFSKQQAKEFAKLCPKALSTVLMKPSSLYLGKEGSPCVAFGWIVRLRAQHSSLEKKKSPTSAACFHGFHSQSFHCEH